MDIGLIGAGRIGANHARILDELEAVDRILIADAAPARAEVVASALSDAAAADLDTVLAKTDGVVIASSTDTHAGRC